MSHPSDNSQRQNSHNEIIRHSLIEISSPRLASRIIQNSSDVNDSVRDHELQEPAERATDSRRQDNGARRCYISVRALLCDMEGRVIATERPDDSEKAH